MTTTVLRAVKFVGARIEKLTENERTDLLETFKQDLTETLKFWVYLAGPILLPLLIMYLEVKF